MVARTVDWHSDVYGEQEKAEPSGNWHETRARIFSRDAHRCQRCEKRGTRKMTVHHIQPRSEGGGDNDENLITLCSECHDFVEITGLKSEVEIRGSFEEVEVRQPEPKRVGERIEHFERPEWHKWVYGGQRRQ